MDQGLQAGAGDELQGKENEVQEEEEQEEVGIRDDELHTSKVRQVVWGLFFVVLRVAGGRLLLPSRGSTQQHRRPCSYLCFPAAAVTHA